MIKADKYYIENLNQILVEMNTDIDPRPKYKDGTPAHCFFITQVFEKYNLANGEFPITTLRNTAIKTGIGLNGILEMVLLVNVTVLLLRSGI